MTDVWFPLINNIGGMSRDSSSSHIIYAALLTIDGVASGRVLEYT